MAKTKKINLDENEEKAMVGILYNHLSFSTSLEVFGELTKEGIDRIDSLRKAFGKLLKKYSLTEALNEETYLLLGMFDYIKMETLKKLAKNENNKHLQNRAKYLLNKFKKNEK